MEEEKIKTKNGVFYDTTTHEAVFSVKEMVLTEKGKEILENPQSYIIPSYPLEEKTFKDILIGNGIVIFGFCLAFIFALLYLYSIGLVYIILGGIAALIYIPISVWLLYSIFQYFFTDRRIW